MTQPPQTSSAQPQPQQKPKLRWFQFGLRTLSIVVTALCIGLAWLVHDVREQEAVVKMIGELNGHVEFGEPSFLGRWSVVRSLFGKHAFAPIEVVSLGEGTTNSHLLPLKKLKQLRILLIDSTQVTELSPLAGLSELTTLYIESAQMSDLSPLNGLSGLTTLCLYHSEVSDLSPLAGLSGLTMLFLEDTQVSDLSPLAGLKNLEAIYLEKDQAAFIPASLEKVVKRYSSPASLPIW